MVFVVGTLWPLDFTGMWAEPREHYPKHMALRAVTLSAGLFVKEQRSVIFNLARRTSIHKKHLLLANQCFLKQSTRTFVGVTFRVLLV